MIKTKCPHCGSTEPLSRDVWKETPMRDGKVLERVRNACRCGQTYNSIELKAKVQGEAEDGVQPKRPRRSTSVRKKNGGKAKRATD